MCELIFETSALKVFTKAAMTCCKTLSGVFDKIP